MSFTSLTYHLVLGTCQRQRTIVEAHERQLYKFIHNFLSGRDIFVRRIGGMPDHVHILCDILPKYAVADVVRLIKSESSKFMKSCPGFPDWYKWADGYGAFTVDASLREARRFYIMNQKQHHIGISYEDEFLQLLREYGVPSNDKAL